MKTKGEFKSRNVGNSSPKIDAEFSTKYHTYYINLQECSSKNVFFNQRHDKAYVLSPRRLGGRSTLRIMIIKHWKHSLNTFKWHFRPKLTLINLLTCASLIMPITISLMKIKTKLHRITHIWSI